MGTLLPGYYGTCRNLLIRVGFPLKWVGLGGLLNCITSPALGVHDERGAAWGERMAKGEGTGV